MRGVLWCNGSIPTESVVEWVLTTGAPVFGVDGGADKADDLGVEVVEVLRQTVYWGRSFLHLNAIEMLIVRNQLGHLKRYCILR